MSILDYFFNGSNKRKRSADVAKERLQIIVAYERNQRQNNPDYLPLLRQEIMAVIKKYVHVDNEQIKVELNQDQDRSVLELNIMLPPEAEEKAQEEQQKEKADEALS